MCQHGIDSLFRRNPYRAGRQSRNPISIIWRFYGQMNIQYAFQRKIPVGKFYRRVCLQGMPLHQSVHIKTRNLSHFIVLLVSSSTIEAKVATSTGVNPHRFACCSRFPFPQ